MFSIEQHIKDKFSGGRNIRYGLTEHIALSAGDTVVDRSQQGAIGFIVYGITYTTALVTAAQESVKINEFLYLHYAAITQLSGFIGIVHFEPAAVMKITCSEADIQATLNFQMITWE